MRVRKLDANYDYSFGHGANDWFVNVPDAPAQCVVTRLNLWLGEWFLDRSVGMPWKTKVLGKYTDSTRDPVIRAYTLATQGVSAIVSYSSTLNRSTRGFAGQMEIKTIYGTAKIVEPQ